MGEKGRARCEGLKSIPEGEAMERLEIEQEEGGEWVMQGAP